MEEMHFIDDIGFTSDLVKTEYEATEPTRTISLDALKLQQLLQEFDMQDVAKYLKVAQITYRSLKYLRADDLKEAIPPCGLRAEFREKLFAWRKMEYGIDEETMSSPSKVTEWLHKNAPFISKPSQPSPHPIAQKRVKVNESKQSSSIAQKHLKKNLEDLLQETSKGRSLLAVYKNNQEFENLNRDELINIIVEDVIFNDIALSLSDVEKLVQEIITLFPNEADFREYYYIPRIGKKNPSGKLYGKYSNCRSKKRKIYGSIIDILPTPAASSPKKIVQEFDSPVFTALRTSLNQISSDWNEVCDNWQKTYQLRQADLAMMDHIEFLNSWPKYTDVRAPELIKIDFNMMYPGKDCLMYTKWDLFKNNIKKYYESNINNERCKELFSIAKTSENKDSQDYILTSLLNAVLPPTTRFKDETGKCCKKATIADAQESFVLRVVSIADCERSINELMLKFFSSGVTIRPFLVVEGASDADISSFYVYFNKHIYKFDSFLDSLDICFKIFQTFSIKYPMACETTWIFVQQFFFDIKTELDSKSARLTSLLNFMKTNKNFMY